MDHKIIFEEYTKASNKVKYIKEKAKSLGVYDSDIICELFKSGYKFEELKRANKATYNAGMKKYEKWKENGSPEDEDADALERTEPEQTEPAPAPSTRVDEENTYDMKKLMDENCQLKADLSQSKCAYDEMLKNYNDAMLMNKQLESQLALEKADNESESRNLKLAYRENEELRTKVQKCEAFIINQMVYLDCSDFGLKHKENGNNM